MKSQGLAVRECVAHLCCKVEETQEKHGHFVLTCQINKGWVRSGYWQDGKCFIAANGLPPLLTFLGSQKFACMVAYDEEGEGKQEESDEQPKKIKKPNPIEEEETETATE